MPAKTVLTPSSILFRPRRDPLPQQENGPWWRRRVPPRVRKAYSESHLSPYLSEDSQMNIEKAGTGERVIGKSDTPTLAVALTRRIICAGQTRKSGLKTIK